ncbi:hypothetical protein ANN_20700 [Periplaneta americana]|uniref:OBG-type G domain-containing protein n=1 Tax=Periplaneta americana TaxID=6978 RepID=A0ABQ8SDB0_PERAM|nr:hypothetical protein ANN_20700 [Periplaneta americana]
MGESRNAYRVLVGRPEGKRPLGRPRRRWDDNIKMDLREVRYDDRDWINLAQDRGQWRAYVRAAMKLRNGEVLNHPNPGRSRISTREEVAMLLSEVENHPFRTASQLKMASNFPGFPHTVKRRFRERGIRCRRAVRREHLTMEHAVDSLRQDFDWRTVIFSDEVIVSSSNDGPALVYRMDGQRYDERFVRRLNRSSRGGGVDGMRWGRTSGTHPRFAMAPKKAEAPEKKPLIGRVGTNLKVGIVGIPNVGKSTFFNVLTKSQAAAENFPFCTIDPNENKYYFYC